MYYFMKIKTVVYVTLIAISFTATAPLCSEDVKTAGGGLPNSFRPLVLSLAAIKGL
jgi:hypothetical protein